VKRAEEKKPWGKTKTNVFERETEIVVKGREKKENVNVFEQRKKC